MPVVLAAVIGVNVGLMASFHRLFCGSVAAQLLILGFLFVADLHSAPVFAILLLIAFVLQLSSGVLLVMAGPGGASAPWPLLRWLFTTAAAVLIVRVAAIVLSELTSGELLSPLFIVAMFLVPAAAQVALLWWPADPELRLDAEAR